jgi:hypothetical protein
VPKEENLKRSPVSHRLNADIAPVVHSSAAEPGNSNGHGRSRRKPFVDQPTQGVLARTHFLPLYTRSQSFRDLRFVVEAGDVSDCCSTHCSGQPALGVLPTQHAAPTSPLNGIHSSGFTARWRQPAYKIGSTTKYYRLINQYSRTPS